MKKDIIFAGFGGQGVLTAGLIIAKTAMDKGDNVTWIPSYGSEMRGGTANCSVRISDVKVPSPFIDEPDVVIAMNLPSVTKFMPALRTNGVLIINRTMVDEYCVFRDDIKVFACNATEIAMRLGCEKAANIAILGALARSGELYGFDETNQGIVHFFEYKERSNAGNSEVLKQGYDETFVVETLVTK